MDKIIKIDKEKLYKADMNGLFFNMDRTISKNDWDRIIDQAQVKEPESVGDWEAKQCLLCVGEGNECTERDGCDSILHIKSLLAKAKAEGIEEGRKMEGSYYAKR